MNLKFWRRLRLGRDAADSARMSGLAAEAYLYYCEACIRWADHPPCIHCIVGKASSLESHERVELIQLVFLKDFDALWRAVSNTVLIDALCRSREVFAIILDCSNKFHIECLVLLSKFTKNILLTSRL